MASATYGNVTCNIKDGVVRFSCGKYRAEARMDAGDNAVSGAVSAMVDEMTDFARINAFFALSAAMTLPD